MEERERSQLYLAEVTPGVAAEILRFAILSHLIRLLWKSS
jgi:hypothetical protein